MLGKLNCYLLVLVLLVLIWEFQNECKKQMCNMCAVCPVCDTVCQPGGFVDSVTGSIYKTVADIFEDDDDDN